MVFADMRQLSTALAEQDVQHGRNAFDEPQSWMLSYEVMNDTLHLAISHETPESLGAP